jgi:ParB-like chromosome segregation protein Spo0J
MKATTEEYEMATMKYHPLSEFFPMLAPADFEELVEDIRAKGQLEPIVTYQGKVLDGRNRYEACETLGIKCRMRELPEGVKPLDYVISANLKRRQLTLEQKIAIMRRIYPNEGKGGDQRSNVPSGTLNRKQIAHATGASENTVQRFDTAASELPSPRRASCVITSAVASGSSDGDTQKSPPAPLRCGRARSPNGARTCAKSSSV